jgi:4-hydroxymandelate oxidase
MAEKTKSSAGGASRRRALGMMGMGAAAVSAGAVGAAMPAAVAQAQAPAAAETFRIPIPPPRLAPRTELVNVLEYETQARLVKGAAMTPVAGSDRTITDRITLRPRMNIDCRGLDLTASLFGDQHFTPIIVGPVANQRRFHAEGEVAMARGASAAKAAIVISSDSSVPLATIAQAATTPLYVQVYAGSPRMKDVLAQASAARAKAVFVTVNAGVSANAGATPAAAPIDWAAVEAVVKATSLPVVVKGITRPADAREAANRGAKGVVVSNYRGGNAASLPGTLLMIQPVVQAVGDRVTVLADGSFRRGTDILKALGLGAKGVLIGRPVMWGLAAYGADGVQGVVEMLQTETARYMAMCCRPSLASIDASVVRIHAPTPPART